jgi:hypothetical protein
LEPGGFKLWVVHTGFNLYSPPTAVRAESGPWIENREEDLTPSRECQRGGFRNSVRGGGGNGTHDVVCAMARSVKQE